MPRTNKPLNTLDYVSRLLAKSARTIMRRENANENRVHLYGVGHYWAAFDRSAYLLEQMTMNESDATVLHLKDYPFPVLMYCVRHEKVEDLCRRYLMAGQGMEYRQIMSHPIDTASYNRWYRGYVIDGEGPVNG